MALVNYEMIQRAVREHREVVPATVSPSAKPSTLPVTALAESSTERGEADGTRVPRRIPRLFLLGDARPNEDALLSVELGKTDYKGLTPKDWLFGQWNRFLPVKATLRALLNIMCEQHSGIPVNEAANKISYVACDLGDYLRNLDAHYARRRENSISAAFPSSTNGRGESRLRYGNQFVGTLRQGKLIGLPAALALVAHDSAKDPNLRLTKAGLQFASLPNPVLDHKVVGGKFTDDEIHFLLHHVQSSVPAEVSAFVAVIDAISDGANTPDKVDAFLRARFDLKDEAAITTTFLSTQRTGAISRLADLGLLAREKDGLRVTYTVTHPGKCFRSQIS